MATRNIGFLVSLMLLSGCGAGEYHCRIIEATSLETGESVGLPFIEEFKVRPDQTTDIYHAGKIYSYAGMGALDPATGQRAYPFVVISKLDGKFDGMYMNLDGDAHVMGYCEKTGLF